MITQQKAKEIAKQYLELKKRRYKEIDGVDYEKDKLLTFGPYRGEERSIFAVSYTTAGYDGDNFYWVYVDAETGKVHYTLGEHGAVEKFERYQ